MKGELDMVADGPALNEIIVFANQLKQDCSEKAEHIRRICLSMEDEESLKGGDGDVIRENFKQIASGINKLEGSITFIVSKLNTSLEAVTRMYAGKNTAASTEAVNAAAKKTGIFNKE